MESFEKTNQLENVDLRAERQKQLDEMMLKVEQIGDRLGKGIDEGVREGVALFIANNINTTGSCEGHDDWGTGGPYIDIRSKEIETLYEQLDKLPENETSDETDPKREEIRNQILKLNLEERRKIIPLFEEFYKDRNVPYDVKLHISSLGNGWSRLENQGVEFQSIETDDSKKKENLKRFQEEMKNFIAFLKEKYLESRPE